VCLAQKEKIHEYIFGISYVVDVDKRHKARSVMCRREFENALYANSAFNNLLKRNATLKDVKALTNEDFIVVNTGVTEFTIRDAEWLFRGAKSETFDITDLSRDEPMFIREEVSVEETFKIGGIPLRPIFKDRPSGIVETTRKVGLYQINGSMEDWADRVTNKLQSERDKLNQPIPPHLLLDIFNQDREWVNDDSLIIAKVIADYSNVSHVAAAFLITDDRRLCNQASQSANITIYRLKPSEIIGLQLYQEYNSQTEFTVEELEPFLHDNFIQGKYKGTRVYVDTGSLAAAASRIEIMESRSAGRPIKTIAQRSFISAGYGYRGMRTETFALKPIQRLSALSVETFRPILRAKRFRYYKHIEPALSDPGRGLQPGSDGISDRTNRTV